MEKSQQKNAHQYRFLKSFIYILTFKWNWSIIYSSIWKCILNEKKKTLEHILLAIMTFKAKFGSINFLFSAG